MARRAGLNWREEPIGLKPSSQLLELVRRSQNLARHEGAEGGGIAPCWPSVFAT